MNDYDDDGGCFAIAAYIAAVLVLALAVVFIAMGGTWHANHVSCLRLHEQTAYPTRMAGNMFSGVCFIQINGRWIPAERYRSVDVDGAS